MNTAHFFRVAFVVVVLIFFIDSVYTNIKIKELVQDCTDNGGMLKYVNEKFECIK